MSCYYVASSTACCLERPVPWPPTRFCRLPEEVGVFVDLVFDLNLAYIMVDQNRRSHET